MMLKCVDERVMDLVSGKVYNKNLLPISSWNKDDVFAWLERRVYSSSNKFARIIAQRREEPSSFKMNLSDSYWITFDLNTTFESVSPYYNEFGTLEFVRGVTEPTLRLMGTFDKEWLWKAGITCIHKCEPALIAKTEVLASGLAALLGVGDSKACLYGGDRDGIGEVYIRNLSSPKRMLLDFGSLLPVDFLKDGFDIEEIQRMYDLVGLNNIHDYILKVSVFDTIIGNGDRRYNQGNWGFFKDTATGKVSTAPAYDFNLAYSLDLDEGLLEQRVRYIRKSNKLAHACLLIEEWESAVSDYCQVYDYLVWHRNLCRLKKKLNNLSRTVPLTRSVQFETEEDKF